MAVKEDTPKWEDPRNRPVLNHRSTSTPPEHPASSEKFSRLPEPDLQAGDPLCIIIYPAMNVEPANLSGYGPDEPTPDAPIEISLIDASDAPELPQIQNLRLVQQLLTELQKETKANTASAEAVVKRIVIEVERICAKSDRIQTSGQVQTWQLTLAQHRLKKCLTYFQQGSRRGRVELHSYLSAMVYRHVAPTRTQLGFQGRYNLIEDFLQSFYIEVMKSFRKENGLPQDYSPRTRLELAEYMAFAEQYAKRRISLGGRRNEQLIILRAQSFARRQPIETSMDIEMAVESGKTEEAEAYSRSPLMQQVREQMVADSVDPSESVLRDRVIQELISYLESQDQQDCVDYLTLKLQDLSAPEIDEILGLTPRQRDYLQQRFKYHVEKFARSHRWQLVHQWLGADLDQNLGMPKQQWEAFQDGLTSEQKQLLQLKGSKVSDQAIAQTLKCTPKQVQKRWVQVLDLAWQFRNRE